MYALSEEKALLKALLDRIDDAYKKVLDERRELFYAWPSIDIYRKET